MTNARAKKGNPLRISSFQDLIVAKEKEDQMGGAVYTPLHESEIRPKQHLVVKHIHGATPTLIWERESDLETTGQSSVSKIMSKWLQSRGKSDMKGVRTLCG